MQEEHIYRQIQLEEGKRVPNFPDHLPVIFWLTQCVGA